MASFLLLSAAPKSPPDVAQLNASMFEAIEKIEGHSFELEKHERVRGRVGFEKWKVEINYDPYWIFMDRMIPENGPTLYWREGENDGDAKVDPNGFPWFDLDLDPRGKTLNKDAHHNIFSLGLKHFGAVWKSLCYSNGSLRAELELLPSEPIDGSMAWVVSVEVPEYRMLEVEVLDGENAFHVSERMLVPADKIVLVNEDVDDLFDLSKGQRILVPSHYASRGKLWIDQKSFLPVKQEIYDDQGLYERYVYSNLKLEVTAR